MTMSRTANPISRRSTLTGLAAGSLGLAMAARSHGVSAQEAPPGDLAEHPIVGTWLMTTAIGPGLAVFAADGIHIGGSRPLKPDPKASRSPELRPGRGSPPAPAASTSPASSCRPTRAGPSSAPSRSTATRG